MADERTSDNLGRQEKSRAVLSDHSRRGKKLVPPYVATLGRPENISWVNTIIPEVIWIGLLHETFGQVRGTELALNLARTVESSAKKDRKRFFAAASDFQILSTEEKATIRNNLESSDDLVPLSEAFFPLFHYYPSFPLNFLSLTGQQRDTKNALQTLKSVLTDLFDKELPRTVFVQSTVVYIAFVLDRLKVVKGLALARFPEVENYPHTEISRRVASAVRTTILSFFGQKGGKSRPSWATEFWNRGVEIENCVFD